MLDKILSAKFRESLIDDFGGNPTIVQPPAKLPAAYQEAAKAHVVLCSTRMLNVLNY